MRATSCTGAPQRCTSTAYPRHCSRFRRASGSARAARRANGGVFLGLNGTVVKSHGSADATGVSSAIKLAFELAQSHFTERLAARVASAALLDQGDSAENTPDEEAQ